MADDGNWTVSPAYDLTFSPGAGGEHALTIAGEGARPTEQHLRAAGKAAGVPRDALENGINQVRSAVDRWPEFASLAGVSAKMSALIDRSISGVR
jgi:serine/threonine-protein kinase HipA